MSNLHSYVNSKSTIHPRCAPCSPQPHAYSHHSDSSLEKVLIMTADSRTLVGNLLSCDQLTNLVLGQATERIIRTPDDPEPSAEVPLGLYLVRGDNVCVVGLIDESLDDSINWEEVKGSAIGGTKHI
ncbi:like-Sm domain-containing protein [Xylariomycetidae sp. FL0641]|nr:like-Sm domain-containing protein [Xylariomycetidae sp. FL0641]